MTMTTARKEDPSRWNAAGLEAELRKGPAMTNLPNTPRPVNMDAFHRVDADFATLELWFDRQPRLIRWIIRELVFGRRA